MCRRWPMSILGAVLTAGVTLLAQAQSAGPIEPTGTSARIAQLKRDLASHPAGVTGVSDRFWTALSREHAPIVEPVPGDPEHLLVTLVWRGDAATTAVQAAGIDLTHIVRTDVWYTTFTMVA